jgi:transposase
VIEDTFADGLVARLLMEDAEWRFFEPFLHAVRGRRPARHHRLVLDCIFWFARTGAQWCGLSEEFGKRSSVDRQFLRWALTGLW